MTCGQNFELMQRQVIPVRRECRVTWAEGLPHAIDVKQFDVRGLIVPLTGRELLLVPEGDRFQQNIWVYTQEILQENDLVIYGGEAYEVQTITAWGSFIQCRAMRMDVGPDAARGTN